MGPTATAPAELLKNVTVVLVEPAHPGNIGATARVLKNTGISRLALVNPGQWDTAEARWMAHGSEEILDNCRIYEDLPSAVGAAHLVIGTTHRRGRYREVNVHPRQLLAEVAPQLAQREIALVFGREKDGLWRRELQFCHQLISFPTAVSHPSLNLSQAVLLCTYELYYALHAAVAAPPQQDTVNAAEREHLFKRLNRTLDSVGFQPFNDDPTNFNRVLRRFINRIPLARRDAMVIHKICSQVIRFAARHKKEKAD